MIYKGEESIEMTTEEWQKAGYVPFPIEDESWREYAEHCLTHDRVFCPKNRVRKTCAMTVPTSDAA